MRSLPSAARQRLAAASLAGVVAIGALAMPNAQADEDPGDGDKKSLEQKQKDVRGQIDRAENDLQEASQAAQAAGRRLDQAETQLTQARNRLSQVTTQLGAAREREREIRAELEAAQRQLERVTENLRQARAEVEAQRGRVREDALDAYFKGPPELRAVSGLMESGSLEDVSRVRLAEDLVVETGDQAFDDLSEAEAQVEDYRSEVKDVTDTLTSKRQEAADTVTEIEGLVAEAAAVRDEVSGLVVDRRGARNAALRAREADRAALDALNKREAAIADRLRAIAERDRNKKGFTGNSGGFLSYPVENSYITSPYGYRTHPIYGYYSLHNGTDFGAGCGTPLKAAASGTIVDTYYDDVYGNRIFLNVGNVNGKNLTVVYNHMSGYAASEGERVSRGETIGYVGTTGWSTGCHLHFTAMVNGQTVNPANYL